LKRNFVEGREIETIVQEEEEEEEEEELRLISS
jgi:hypothetical protein